jgi:hypothetical protein
VINVFSLESPKDDPDFSLIGHTENVCALDVTAGGAIISGSWDKYVILSNCVFELQLNPPPRPRTVKVWKNFQLVHDLKGHQQSVWAVLAIDEECVLTGTSSHFSLIGSRANVFAQVRLIKPLNFGNNTKIYERSEDIKMLFVVWP